MKFIYMDDLIDSVEIVEKGIQLYKELDSFWGIVGMKVRKWILNFLEVVQGIFEDDRVIELQIIEGQEFVVKIFGIF